MCRLLPLSLHSPSSLSSISSLSLSGLLLASRRGQFEDKAAADDWHGLSSGFLHEASKRYTSHYLLNSHTVFFSPRICEASTSTHLICPAFSPPVTAFALVSSHFLLRECRTLVSPAAAAWGFSNKPAVNKLVHGRQSEAPALALQLPPPPKKVPNKLAKQRWNKLSKQVDSAPKVHFTASMCNRAAIASIPLN